MRELIDRELIDTERLVETPEGVELGLRVVGPIPRFHAWLIDVLFRVVVYIALGIPFSLMGEGGQGLILIMMFLGEWFYPVYFEVRRDGMTPGKKAMGIRVVRDDGAPLDVGPSLIRNLLRWADFLPPIYGFGLISTLLHRDFKRLGDMVAGTIVVYADVERARGGVPGDDVVPVTQTLSYPEQQAVIAFAERTVDWTEERATELSNLVTPLSGVQGVEGVRRLQGMARWLLGRR